MNATTKLQVCACLLALLACPSAATAEEGYWKLAGGAQFLNPRVPPQGPSTRSGGGWAATYSVEEGKVGYKVVSTFNPQNQVTIVMEGSWAPPPSAIYPGEVIPVRARAAVLEARGKGIGGGDPVVQCRVAAATVKDGRSMPIGELVPLFVGPNRGGARGMAGAFKEFVNTTEVLGKKGGNFASIREVYLVYIVGHGQAHSEQVQVAYRYEWVNGAVPRVELGKIWRVKDEGWEGVWTRRGSSNVFDGVWTKGSQKLTAVLTITITGEVVTVDRTQSSNGDVCTYSGTIAADGRSVAGMVRSYGGGGSLTRWSAVIER